MYSHGELYGTLEILLKSDIFVENKLFPKFFFFVGGGGKS